MDPHGRYIGLLLDGQRNAVYISGPQFFKVNLNYSGSMVDVTQETRGVMESLPKELELESHGIDSLLESIPVVESIPPHRGSYSSVECG